VKGAVGREELAALDLKLSRSPHHPSGHNGASSGVIEQGMLDGQVHFA
jgi:hypothetical protein